MATPLTPKLTEDQHHRIAYLLYRYLQKKITRAEHDELDAWVIASDDHILLYEALTNSNFLEALTGNRPLIEAFITRYDPKS